MLTCARFARSARSARGCTLAERLSDDDVASTCDRKIAVRRKTHIAAVAVEEISAQWRGTGEGPQEGGGMDKERRGEVAERVNVAA